MNKNNLISNLYSNIYLNKIYLKNKKSGFTLPEMMIVLIIISILSALAIPSYRYFVINHQLQNTVDQFFLSLTQARSEAMRFRATALLEPIDKNSGWLSGWRVYVDHNRNGKFDESSDLLLLKTEEIPAPIKINLSNGKTTGAFKDALPPFFSYSSAGFANAAHQYPARYSGSSNGKIWFVAETGRQRVIIVSVSGRVRICDPDKDKNKCTN